MKLTSLIAIVAFLVPIGANPVDQSLALRAFPNAPDGYTPGNVTCPANSPTIRDAASLSSNETAWLQIRRNNTIEPMKNLLSRALNSTSFDAAGYIDRVSGNVSNLPNIAIAVSGGGYRAMLNGGGAIKAFDNRTVGSTSSGQLGGLLQSATYVSGLSGGGWLVGSVYVNNFTTISNLQSGNSGDLWQLSTSILEGPKTGFFQTVSTIEYWRKIYDMVNGKDNAGFNTSLTDYWGRALSFQFINATSNDGGPSYTWSSIALTSDFQNGLMPMPFLVAVGRSPGELVIGSNSTVYEFNPFEFGSFDPSIFAFAPLQYLGTRFAQGSVASSAPCVRGFDNAGFVMGTSSSLFNQFILQLNDTSLPSIVKSAFRSILQNLGNDGDDIAVYAPNPFYQFNATMASIANSQELDVVDGGEDGQNVPLHPLIQPTRHIDVIFAVDSSADTNFNWPNGSSLVATYERSLNSSGIGNGTAFPSIPDVNTFVNLGLNTQPTFFGCNSSNITGPSPLVVYLPNSYYSNNSNTSTFQLSYSNAQRDAIITNGYNVVTRGNGTVDTNWPSCVGCAILQRSAERTNTALPDICNTCFNKYCWNGTLDSSTPKQSNANTDLATRSAAVRRKLSWIGVMMALTLGLFATL